MVFGEVFGVDVWCVFFVDGDVLVLLMCCLFVIFEVICCYLFVVCCVLSYCLLCNLYKKLVEELCELVDVGLFIVYVGVEFGDDEVFVCVNKGEMFELICEVFDKFG